MIYLNNSDFDYIINNNVSIKKVCLGEDVVWENTKGDFIRVEYIENTSNAYIDTGLNCNSNYQFYIDVLLKTLNRTNFIFGGRRKNNVIDSNSNYSMGLYVNANNNFGSMMVRSSSVYADYTVETDKRYTISGDPNALTISYMGIDEETQEEIEQSFVLSISGTIGTYGQPLYIFNTYQPTINANNALIGRIYKFQIKNASGTLIRDYIPMYQVSTDTYGLWDRVNEEFYTSPNGVKFTGGERVIADANDNIYYFKNYVNVSSSKYISIGIYPDAQDSWEADFYFNGTGRNYAWGSWSGGGTSLNDSYGINTYNKQLLYQYDNQEFAYSYSYGNKRMILKADKNVFYKDGQKLGELTEKTDNQASKVMYLGNFNGSSYAGNGKLYYFKYWRHGELVRYYIPVQRCSDNVYGLFDKSRLLFQGSATSTAFTGG